MFQKNKITQLDRIVDQMVVQMREAKAHSVTQLKIADNVIEPQPAIQKNQVGFKSVSSDLGIQPKIKIESNPLLQTEVKGKKYKKYSVALKKSLVEQIKLEAEQTKKPLYGIIKAKSIQKSIHIKNITRWYNLKQIRNRQGGRKPAHPQVQQKLIQYIKNHPKSKRRAIIYEAKKYLEQLNGPNKPFNFSKGWYERFKARHLRKNKAGSSQQQQQQQQQVDTQTAKLSEN